MKIAFIGCAHGEIELIYSVIQHKEQKHGFKVDLLICCGHFQATRNDEDLSCMAGSEKYRNICSFYKYYSGKKVAPILTLFIGGNCEASNHLQELPYGGWVAPNIYYLGYAGVVSFGGVRIAGLSGTYKIRDYLNGHYEKPPYNEESKRSVYHIRQLEVFRLQQLTQPIDFMISHDWLRNITEYGDVDELLKRNPFLQKEMEETMPADLLHILKPAFWFAAHRHCKFSAIIPHGPGKGETRFFALDKCLPKRKFLQVIQVHKDESKPLELSYDLEWLTILHLTNHLLSVKKRVVFMPGPSCEERYDFTPTEVEKKQVLKRFNSDLKVPWNFKQTVEAWSRDGGGKSQPGAQLNPQTATFCRKLGIDDPIELLLREDGNQVIEIDDSEEEDLISLPPQHQIQEEDKNIQIVSTNIKSKSQRLKFPKTKRKLPKHYLRTPHRPWLLNMGTTPNDGVPQDTVTPVLRSLAMALSSALMNTMQVEMPTSSMLSGPKIRKPKDDSSPGGI